RHLGVDLHPHLDESAPVLDAGDPADPHAEHIDGIADVEAVGVVEVGGDRHGVVRPRRARRAGGQDHGHQQGGQQAETGEYRARAHLQSLKYSASVIERAWLPTAHIQESMSVPAGALKSRALALPSALVKLRTGTGRISSVL